jgi:hypothetical protein
VDTDDVLFAVWPEHERVNFHGACCT